MKTMRLLKGTLAVAVPALFLVSCSLEQLKSSIAHRPTGRGSPLQPSVQYEVRTALAAGAPFRPAQLRGYHFVLDQHPHPPMLAARGTAAAGPQRTMVARVVASPARARPPLRPDAERSGRLIAGKMGPASPSPVPGGKLITVRTTAYCHDEADHIVYGRLTAVGTRLKFGAVRSAAADWSRYPVGTRFRIAGQPGIVYEVDDYGSALVGTGTIDLYQPTRAAMNKWGVRHVDIEVLQWGSYEQSMDIMSDRTRWPHVRRMINDIQSRVYQVTADSVKAKPEPVAL